MLYETDHFCNGLDGGGEVDLKVHEVKESGTNGMRGLLEAHKSTSPTVWPR